MRGRCWQGVENKKQDEDCDYVSKRIRRIEIIERSLERDSRRIP
jgi:hypothetical protein